jgi:hypothetical protein
MPRRTRKIHGRTKCHWRSSAWTEFFRTDGRTDDAASNSKRKQSMIDNKKKKLTRASRRTYDDLTRQPWRYRTGDHAHLAVGAATLSGHGAGPKRQLPGLRPASLPSTVQIPLPNQITQWVRPPHTREKVYQHEEIKISRWDDRSIDRNFHPREISHSFFQSRRPRKTGMTARCIAEEATPGLGLPFSQLGLSPFLAL